MKKLTLLAFLISFAASAQTLTLKWQTDTLLRVPESVLADAERKVLYVACIDGDPGKKDGKGFIAKVSPDGKIIATHWAEGLDAPKGMGLYKNNLYVADITRIVIIDIATGKITNSIEVEGAQFLNDITIDASGGVYISDTATGKIHILKGNKVEVYFTSPEFKGINGLLALMDGLYVVDFENGLNYKLSTDKKLMKFGVTAYGADGVVSIGKNEYIVSSWGGELYFVDATGKSTKMLDTKEQKISAADIWYDAKSKTVYVPTFFANSVMAYSFEKK
jgi:sugar lactone lactonase YvrE